jgi:ubiquinone/menaquinone biosynthesis C-methylase UbiE
VGRESASDTRAVLPVPRPKQDARRFYDRISRVYGCISRFERKHAERALERLRVTEGETVLEIGFGSGHCLVRIAESVGETGKAHGIDISPGMLDVARRRLRKAGLLHRVDLSCADAASLPYEDGTIDAAFMSFTLELFDTPEIPRVLEELKRVLSPGGRLAIVSMSREGGRSVLLRLYEWAHRRWPKYLDCRPIYVEQSVDEAGYRITWKDRASLFGLPEELIVAVKTGQAGNGGGTSDRNT